MKKRLRSAAFGGGRSSSSWRQTDGRTRIGWRSTFTHVRTASTTITGFDRCYDTKSKSGKTFQVTTSRATPIWISRKIAWSWKWMKAYVIPTFFWKKGKSIRYYEALLKVNSVNFASNTDGLSGSNYFKISTNWTCNNSLVIKRLSKSRTP